MKKNIFLIILIMVVVALSLNNYVQRERILALESEVAAKEKVIQKNAEQVNQALIEAQRQAAQAEKTLIESEIKSLEAKKKQSK